MRLKRRPVQGFSHTVTKAFAAIVCLVGVSAFAEEDQPSTAVLISVAEQKLVILRDGGWIKKYPVSTSKFGLGDAYGSYKTPVGKLRVCEKIGNDLTPGAVLKQRHATGEVLPVNAPGRDPIVTRIIWLDGLEPQNVNARQRGIYIHGTVEESKIGEPVSYGCIRMRSKDVVEVFEELPLDTPVTIIAEKLPRIAKYSPPKPPIIAAAPKPTPTPATPAPEIATAKKGAPAIPSPAPAVVAQAKPGSEKPARLEPPAKLELPLNPGANIVLKKPEPPVNPTASLALKGSILDAGLPEGPKIPVLPKPPEPKDVPRFGTLAPGLGVESALPVPETSPGTPLPATEETETATDSSKPSRIAFRANGATAKPKR